MRRLGLTKEDLIAEAKEGVKQSFLEELSLLGFKVGSRVVVGHLSSNTEFNGREGKLEGVGGRARPSPPPAYKFTLLISSGFRQQHAAVHARSHAT